MLLINCTESVLHLPGLVISLFPDYTCKFFQLSHCFLIILLNLDQNTVCYVTKIVLSLRKETQTIKWPFMSLLVLQFQGFTVNILPFSI